MEDSTFPFPNLPSELIVEILTWLPVKPLLKLKCVCKSWRALISSQQFVKSHLENSKLDRSFTTQRLLMQFRGNFKQVSANSMLHEPVFEAFDLSSPFQPCRYPEVVGSCNGLLCLAVISLSGKYIRIELILGNPSTRIEKELPDFELNAHPAAVDLCLTNYGFGYDKSSDDYKVVRFFGGDKHSSESEVMLQVYSLRNDEWKTAKPLGMPYLEMSRPATFVNGKLYWIGSQMFDPEDEDVFVVCFDLETEEYEILQLPNWLKRFSFSSFGEFGGSLPAMWFRELHSEDGCRVGDGKWAKIVTIPMI